MNFKYGLIISALSVGLEADLQIKTETTADETASGEISARGWINNFWDCFGLVGLFYFTQSVNILSHVGGAIL